MPTPKMHSHPTNQGLLAAYNVHEAKSALSKLIARVEAGEQIILCRHGVAIARLVPEIPPAEGERRAGRARGHLTVQPEFDRAARLR